MRVICFQAMNSTLVLLFHLFFYLIDGSTVIEMNVCPVKQNRSKLLVILVDGFRWDYVSLDPTLKGFRRIAANGVHAQSVRPIFPANSYPNWYTITTGLHAESHGMIQNLMYDKCRNDTFLMEPHPNSTHKHWWNKTEPLWVTAEKNGIRTAMYMWGGCQVTIGGVKVSHCVPYLGSFDFKPSAKNTRAILDKVLKNFRTEQFGLALVYYELVDHMGNSKIMLTRLTRLSLLGHLYGPMSESRAKASKQIDRILNDLFDDIIRLKLAKELNVVIVSDHGMASLKKFTTIFLNETIDFRDAELILGNGSLSQILPKPGKVDKIYNQLKQVKGLTVYKKDDIPDSYHFKNSPLVLPILVLVHLGYTLHMFSDPNPVNYGGNHGYLPSVPDMHGIMYGFGPAFKRGFMSESIEMVDHYNLFCHLLDIPPHPNNGTISRALQYLK